MSLPIDPKTPWPPAESAADYPCWAAWYSGESDALKVASQPVNMNPIARLFFWRRQKTADERAVVPAPHQLHMPLAADIAQTSADLLFGDPITLTLPEVAEASPAAKGARRNVTQERLEDIVEESGLHNDLLEAAETGAAMGGVYLRATWDAELSYPFITALQADAAVPEWRWGQLEAVTFWRELERDGQKVWRHLERHEKGQILHGLYLGTPNELGESRALDVHAATRELEPVVALPKGLERDVWYVPNQRPNLKVRTSPVGRPDVAGSEGALDALDETWSSLIRDVRLGKARIIVPSDALEPATKRGGRGAGRMFDIDREVFTELQGIDPANANAITAKQFDIRSADHMTVALNLIEQVVSNAGYSPQTFGLKIEGRAESGTALRIRERKTFQTLQRKRRYWQPALQAAAHALLVIDREIKGNRKAQPDIPLLAWPEDDLNVREVASTLNLLKLAEAASTYTRVKMLNPTWKEEEVESEVERINDELGSLVASPEF